MLGAHFNRICLFDGVKDTAHFWNEYGQHSPDFEDKSPKGIARFVGELFTEWNNDFKSPSPKVKSYYAIQSREMAKWYDGKAKRAQQL
eukprot:700655-Amphidinium_carterae.1